MYLFYQFNFQVFIKLKLIGISLPFIAYLCANWKKKFENSGQLAEFLH